MRHFSSSSSNFAQSFTIVVLGMMVVGVASGSLSQPPPFPFSGVRCDIEHLLCEESSIVGGGVSSSSTSSSSSLCPMTIRLAKTPCKVVPSTSSSSSSTAAATTTMPGAQLLELLSDSRDHGRGLLWRVEGSAWDAIGMGGMLFEVDPTSGWAVLRPTTTTTTANQTTSQDHQLSTVAIRAGGTPRSSGVAGYLKGRAMCGTLVLLHD